MLHGLTASTYIYYNLLQMGDRHLVLRLISGLVSLNLLWSGRSGQVFTHQRALIENSGAGEVHEVVRTHRFHSPFSWSQCSWIVPSGYSADRVMPGSPVFTEKAVGLPLVKFSLPHSQHH